MVAVFALIISAFVIAYGAFCLVSPKRAISLAAKTSLLVSAESTESFSLRLQYRVMGLIFIVMAGLFVLLILARVV